MKDLVGPTHLHTMHPSSAFRATSGTKIARLILGCALLPLLTCGAFTKNPKWEYQVVAANLGARQLTVFLNNQAAEGWELVQITENRLAVFKRKR
jgi:hypothetical protein